VILVLLTELVPDWSKGFAVSAPWGVELDEDVLGGVKDEVVEVLADDDLDGVGGIVWDVFGLKVSGNGAIEDTVGEGLDAGGGQVFGLWRVLGHVLLHVDDSHGWAVLVSDAEEFHDSLVVLNIAVDKDEEKLALELLGGLGEVGDDGVVVGSGLGGEEEVVLLEVTTEDLGGGLVGEFVDEGELLSADEGDEFFLGGSGKVGRLSSKFLRRAILPSATSRALAASASRTPKLTSSKESPAPLKTASSAATKPTTTTSLSSRNFSAASAPLTGMQAGPDFLVTHETISSDFRPPL